MQKNKFKQKYEFDSALYKNDFQKSFLWWALGVYAIFAVFKEPLNKCIGSLFINPIISYCPQNEIFIDIIFGLMFFSAIYYFLRNSNKRLIISLKSLISCVTTTIIYIQFFRFDHAYQFYKFHCILFRNIAYADVFAISIALLTATYKSYLKRLESPRGKLSFIEDNPSPTNYKDAYSRSQYATQLAEHIKATSTDKSFSIAIIGEWGSGKTDFMFRLKNALSADPNNIVFDFNPWRVSKPEAIIEEFFKTLSKGLKPFNRSIAGKIKEYSKRILQTGKEIQYRFLDTLFSEWTPEESIEDRYNSINISVQATGKKVIVLIDDIDRLSGKEIMEVLRLIRNAANFSNTFFISGLDQSYIIDALKKTQSFANEGEYLKKVFQLTITLPAFKKDILISEITQLLITEDLSEKDQAKIRGALSKLSIDYSDSFVKLYPTLIHEDILEEFIDNIRDLKRFCNSFKIAFNILKDEVDIHDLFVLELIRNRNIEVYNGIRNRRFLTFAADRRDMFSINEEVWKAFQEKESSYAKKELDKLKNGLDYLVKNEPYKNHRKFAQVHNFYLYFSYQLFNLISFKEFNSALELSSKEISTKIDHWVSENKQAELFGILSDLADFPDSKFLHKMIVAYLNVTSDHEFWLRLAQKLIYTFRYGNQETYFNKDKSLHRKFLFNLMSDSSIRLYDRAFIAGTFLTNLIVKEEHGEEFFSKKELQKLIYKLFDEYLRTVNNLDISSLSFLYLNDDRRKDGNVELYLPACCLFKKALLSNDTFFTDYLKLLFRPATSSYDGYIVFEPYILQIFGDWSVFKTRLEQVQFEDQNFDRFREITLKYIGNLLPFKVSGEDDVDFINQWLLQNKVVDFVHFVNMKKTLR